MEKGIKLISGGANRVLSLEIAKSLDIPLTDISLSRFADGEIFVKINENIRGHDVFLIQPTCAPVNDNIIELLLILDSLKRASAKRVTVVMPYYGYARQDRKDDSRVPISARLMANIIEKAGADRIVAMDLHADQIQGFFDKPLDHLYASPVFIDYLKKNKNLHNMVVVAPDVGAIKRARSFAKRLNVDLVVVDKRRINSLRAEVMHILGDVNDRYAVIVDDMVATAGSLIEAANAIKANGAQEIIAVATHPVLAGPAIERIENSCITQLIVSDSIPIAQEKRTPKIKVLSIAELLGKAIQRIHNDESVSSLFNFAWMD